LVELANLKVLQDRFRFVSVQHWPYHTETGVIYFSDLESITESPEEFKDFLETLDALADYPLLDDEEWSLQENEAIEEAWDNWFGSDFSSSLCDIVRREEKLLHGKNKRKHISRKKALEKLEDKINDLETDQLKEMCRKLEDKTCTYWENESGNSMYISLKRLLTPVRVKFRTIPIKGKYTVTATLVY
jgi:hypothetical protein